nr:MAG TPA: hypothetical protein [Herelleviridae sp.]
MNFKNTEEIRKLRSEYNQMLLRVVKYMNLINKITEAKAELQKKMRALDLEIAIKAGVINDEKNNS